MYALCEAYSYQPVKHVEGGLKRRYVAIDFCLQRMKGAECGCEMLAFGAQT
jgi:hypothetical protein